MNSEFFHKLDPYSEVMMTSVIDAVAQKHGLDLIENGSSVCLYDETISLISRM